MKEETKGWQLDKKIPVIPALLLIVQTFGLVWYGAKLDSRVWVLEEKAIKNDPVIARLTALETQMDMVMSGRVMNAQPRN